MLAVFTTIVGNQHSNNVLDRLSIKRQPTGVGRCVPLETERRADWEYEILAYFLVKYGIHVQLVVKHSTMTSLAPLSSETPVEAIAQRPLAARLRPAAPLTPTTWVRLI